MSPRLSGVALGILAVGLAAAFGMRACTQSKGAAVGECRPAATLTSPAPRRVSTVSILWDVSGSMKEYASKGGKRAALGALLRDLDRRWVRQAQEAGIEAVRHLGIGSELVPLEGPPAFASLVAPWTNLPAAALRIATELADSPNAAFILVSDMQLELPPETAGRPLCGSIVGPSGGGVAPSLFAQCLVQGWRSVTPEGLQVRSLVFGRPTDRAGGPPLFLTVFSREPEFSESLLKAIVSDTALAATEPRELLFISHASVAPCGHIEACRFSQRSEFILKETTAKTCDFVLAGRTDSHALRCTASLNRAGRGGLIGLAIDQVELSSSSAAEGHKTLPVGKTKGGADYADVRVAFEETAPKAPPVVQAKLRLVARWAAVEGADELLTKWLGEKPTAHYPYPEVFGPLFRGLVTGMQAPVCDATWSIRYSR